MNRAYRLIWNRMRETWIIVAEKISARGVPLALTVAGIASLALFAGKALALPTAGQVVSGTASISSSGSTMTITNSPNAIINWQGFSIAAKETTRFIQQSPNSSVLNRVIGGNSSQIYGALQSNGKVFLINQNGILFGSGAVINVNGLIASTLNITNEDFLAGRMKFTAGPIAGSLVNQGTITTPGGGSVYLIATNVENSGVITAPNGDILLAAGKELLLVDKDSPEIATVVNAPEGQALNLGTLTANAGRVGVYGSIVRQKGLISANSAVQDTGGRIFLKATKEATVAAGSITTANGSAGGSITVQATEGTTLVSGTVEARGETGTGGTVQLLGQQVGLIDQAQIDASGSTGGGTVLVGGDYQGKNMYIQNARATYMGTDTVIKADAVENGNGGKVILWADDVTRAYGNIYARGGANGGNGGFVETSGKGHLDFQALVSTVAPLGFAGTLLLDPTNVWIANDLVSANAAGMTGTDTSINLSGPSIFSASGSVLDSLLTVTALEAALGYGNVEVTTANASGTGTGNLTVVDPIYFYSNNLTLTAANNIAVNNSITSEGTGSIIALNAGNQINLNADIRINYNADTFGAVYLSSGTGGITGSAQIEALQLKLLSSGNVSTRYKVQNLTAGPETGLLAANVTGNLSVELDGGDGAYSVDTVDGTVGITSSGNVSLYATGAGKISVDKPINAGAGVVQLFGYGIDINTGSVTIGDQIKLGATGGAINLNGGVLGGAATRQIELVADLITGTGTTVAVSSSSLNNEIQYRPYTASNSIATSDIPIGSWDAPTLVFGDDNTMTGNILVDSTLSWIGGNRQRLAFLTQGSVSSSAEIMTPGLAVIAGGAINLSNTNSVNYIAMKSSGGGNIAFSNGVGFTVTSATGGINNPTTITGISTPGGAISLNSGSGDIWVSSPVNAGTGAVSITSAGGIYTGSAGSVNVIGGSFTGHAGTNIGGPAYSFMTKTPTWNSLYASGDLYLDNTGAVTTASSVEAGGILKLSAHSPLTIGISGAMAGGDITLEASPMGGLDDLTINGQVTSSAGNIYLRAGHLIYENALVSAPNGIITRTELLNGSAGIIPSGLQPIPPNNPIYNEVTLTSNKLLQDPEADTSNDTEEEEEKETETQSGTTEKREGATDAKDKQLPYCN